MIESIAKEVDRITDRLGKRIDSRIKKAVIAFRCIGLSTSGSCEGHLCWGHPYPWIEINVDDADENQRCRNIINQLLSKYSNKEYIYIWKMGMYNGFRIQTVEASSKEHLVCLRLEMDAFAEYCYAATIVEL